MKRSYIKPRPKRHCNETPATREAVYAREWCEGCARKGRQRKGFEIHHKVPKRMGGTTHLYTKDELELLCDECHRAITENR